MSNTNKSIEELKRLVLSRSCTSSCIGQQLDTLYRRQLVEACKVGETVPLLPSTHSALWSSEGIAHSYRMSIEESQIIHGQSFVKPISFAFLARTTFLCRDSTARGKALYAKNAITIRVLVVKWGWFKPDSVAKFESFRALDYLTAVYIIETLEDQTNRLVTSICCVTPSEYAF